MSTTVVQPYSALQSNLLMALNDTQTKKPFENAQSVNCSLSHSFSLVTVQKIFGELNNGICERPGPCPDCTVLKGNVTTYNPNTRLQQLVDAVLNPEILKNTGLVEQKNELYNYPFEAFNFNLEPIKGHREGEGCTREIWDFNFKAENKNSPIQSFQIFILIKDPYWNKELEDPKFYLNLRFSHYLDAEKFTVYANNMSIEAQRVDTNVLFDTINSTLYLKFIDTFMANNIFKEDEIKQYEKEMEGMSAAFAHSASKLARKRVNNSP